MENSSDVQRNSFVLIERIIEEIRACRDQLIGDLLEESSLLLFLETHYDTIYVSKVKQEFLRRSLLELKYSSLDPVHYSALIKKMRELNTTIPERDHPLFLSELKLLFERLGFRSMPT